VKERNTAGFAEYEFAFGNFFNPAKRNVLLLQNEM